MAARGFTDGYTDCTQESPGTRRRRDGDSDAVHGWTALALPATPRAAGHFRRHAVSAAHRWGLHPDSGDLVEACVSELVTNAIVHGVGRDVLMMLYYTGDSVLTEVFGNALDEPVIPATARSDNAESGRGLLIVDTLAEDWGSEHTGLGLLRVWASIAVSEGASAFPDTSAFKDTEFEETEFGGAAFGGDTETPG